VGLGGLYPTILPEHARKHTGADFIVQGDWEKELPQHLKSILGTDVQLAHPLEVKPAFEPYSQLDYITMITSRGCPFRCSYCASPLIHPQLERKDPGMAVEEIEDALNRIGVKDVVFYDDALIVDESSHLSLILQKVLSKNLEPRFHTPNAMHLRGMTRDLARLLKRSGFKTLRFGLESTNPERQKRTGGKVTNDEFIQAVEYLEEAGFVPDEIGVYLLVGLPGQKPEEIEQDIRFVIEYGATPYLAEYSPIPGTPLWKEAVESARYNIQDEPLFHNNSLLPCAHPLLTPQEFSRLKKMCMQFSNSI
jgi:radical SAM superfamily enzyme YgiQ (UPF0313 family)